MVKFRGINISAISQIDARPLPEYSTAHAFGASGCTAACYLPIYPGSQIWFEHSIDGPHPQNAMYLFKLFMDSQLVTSWDCNEKHGYHGKAAYSLHTAKSGNYGERVVVQQSFMFSTTDGRKSPSMKDDCIEIRVHRIQHRRRIRDLPLDSPIPKQLHGPNALRLVGGSVIEQGRPARRYQYQLLDPKDEPYATFRFYCRTKGYLERHQIRDIGRSQSPASLATSGSHYLDPDTPPRAGSNPLDMEGELHAGSPSKAVPVGGQEVDVHSAIKIAQDFAAASPRVCIPRLITESSVVSKIKDSIEDLPSAVPRSPQVAKFGRRLSLRGGDEAIPSSPILLQPTLVSHPLSPNRKPITINPAPAIQAPLLPPTRPSHQHHKRNKPNLTLTLDGVTFDLNCKKSRPLSPFTSGGFLRRLVSSPVPPTAPAAVTESGSTVKDEVNEQIKELNLCQSIGEARGNAGKSRGTEKTTRQQRGGYSLMGFLGRRVDRRSAT